MGVGAVVGALVTGARGRASPGLLAGAAIAFGGLSLLAAGAPTLALEVAVLAPLGAASVMLRGQRSTPRSSSPATRQMRGRVMALYSVVFLGTTPIGAPLAGWLSEAIDPRAALVMAGVAGIVAGLLARYAFARVAADHARSRPQPCKPRRGYADEYGCEGRCRLAIFRDGWSIGVTEGPLDQLLWGLAGCSCTAAAAGAAACKGEAQLGEQHRGDQGRGAGPRPVSKNRPPFHGGRS